MYFASLNLDTKQYQKAFSAQLVNCKLHTSMYYVSRSSAQLHTQCFDLCRPGGIIQAICLDRM